METVKMQTLISSLALLMLPFAMWGQVAELSVENQYQDGTDVYFDIYLRSQSADPFFLGSADFTLTFNHGNFTHPTLSFVTDTDPLGNCNFVPTISNFINDLATRDNYFSSSATSISADRLTINLDGPSPLNQSEFDTRVARVDNQSHTHRLGTFRITGSDQTGNLGLNWYISGNSISTKVFALADTPPFASTEISFSAINPQNLVLPIELLDFYGKGEKGQIKLFWKTELELNNSGFEVHKLDAQHSWKVLGYVPATNDRNSQYSYSDPDPNLGENFYRLKQIDHDGTVSFSTIVIIKHRPIHTIDVFPNPARNHIIVPESRGREYKITNQMGNLISKGILDDELILIDQFPDGLYFLTIGEKVFKFFKF